MHTLTYVLLRRTIAMRVLQRYAARLQRRTHTCITHNMHQTDLHLLGNALPMPLLLFLALPSHNSHLFFPAVARGPGPAGCHFPKSVSSAIRSGTVSGSVLVFTGPVSGPAGGRFCIPPDPVHCPV